MNNTFAFLCGMIAGAAFMGILALAVFFAAKSLHDGTPEDEDEELNQTQKN